MSNRRSIRTVFAASVLGLIIAATLVFQYRAVADYMHTTQSVEMAKNANLGDELPGLLGAGLTPILW